ncbi:MAG: hypothetical protein P8J30_05210 [Ilumatobacter sp.]|nr:hypothetical protein [Ilumatobacter sp.]
MTIRSTGRALGVSLLAVLLLPHHASAQEPGVVGLLVRVFDGLREVTADCEVAVYPVGLRDTAVPAALRMDGWTHVDVPAGFYDLQVTRRDADGVTAVTWIERLSVLQYADEAEGHREIVNLQPAFGALLISPPPTWQDGDHAWRAGVFLHGSEGRAGFAPVTEDAVPRVFVLPAGRYDLTAVSDPVEVTVSDIEVPANHTRMTVLAAPTGDTRP